MDLIRYGARALFGGARRGSSPLAGLGAVLLAVGWLRKLSRPKRELIYSRNLRHGETVRIRLLESGEPATTEIVGGGDS